MINPEWGCLLLMLISIGKQSKQDQVTAEVKIRIVHDFAIY